MKCDKCGYSDNGSGDWAHVCGPVEIKKPESTNLIRKFEKESGLEIYGLGARREKWEHCIEKFTELVVRECMKESMDEIVADEEIAQEKDPLIGEYLNGNNQGIVDAVVRFRNHFGVEE